MKFLFWSAWACAALAAAVVVFFFFWGLSDGTVSSFNGALWAGLLLGVAAVTGGSLWLKKAGQTVLATVVAMLLAVPAVLALLFLLIVLIAQPRWN